MIMRPEARRQFLYTVSTKFTAGKGLSSDLPATRTRHEGLEHTRDGRILEERTANSVVVVVTCWSSGRETVTVLTGPLSSALSRSDTGVPVWDDCCERADPATEATKIRMLARESRMCTWGLPETRDSILLR